jgi:hypothetical protein
VIDDTVPADPRPEMTEYECGQCHRTEWWWLPPVCPCNREKMTRKSGFR